jgi:hypothetical protein
VGDSGGSWADDTDLLGMRRVRKKPLCERVHRCSCGLVMSRDQNAAINILRLGRSCGEIPQNPGQPEIRTLPIGYLSVPKSLATAFTTTLDRPTAGPCSGWFSPRRRASRG